jgi:prepilin-type N-terminal cleavage/methylation domain-containing protein
MNAKEGGFTLLELMVIVAIIGILTTIAIANYAAFKSLAYNATAASDARGIAPGASLASDPQHYTAPLLITLDGTGGLITQLPGANYSPGTFGTISIPAADQFTVTTFNIKGDTCYKIDSQNSSGLLSTPFPCS